MNDFGDDAIIVDRALASVSKGPFHLAEVINPQMSHNFRFASRRGLLGHLWEQAIEELESDEAMRGSARHAKRSGDYSYIVHDLTRKRVEPTPWRLQDIHYAYLRRARRSFRAGKRLDLDRVAALRRAMTVDPLDDRERRWNHWLAFARAELSEGGLTDTLDAIHVPPARGRTRL